MAREKIFRRFCCCIAIPVSRCKAVCGCFRAAGTVNVERHAFALAEANRARIDQVRLGQTFVEVEKIKGQTERRAARLRYDHVSVEELS